MIQNWFEVAVSVASHCASPVDLLVFSALFLLKNGVNV